MNQLSSYMHSTLGSVRTCTNEYPTAFKDIQRRKTPPQQLAPSNAIEPDVLRTDLACFISSRHFLNEKMMITMRGYTHSTCSRRGPTAKVLTAYLRGY